MTTFDRRAFLNAISSSPALFLLPLSSGCGSGPSTQTDGSVALSPPDLPAKDELTHLLHRTRFATTTADIAAARDLGAQGYLEQQLQAPPASDLVYLEADARYPVTALPPPLNAPLLFSPEQATQQLTERTLFLAAYSNHQLFELVVDFWTNHFNIENVTGELPLHKLFDDREVIRRHAFGRFSDLLMASARSPAMLEYLDSVNNLASGPNENYARELMELHTLGVNGGYTENDVKEVARCFTGWGINGLTRNFEFNASQHDADEKIVLGHVIPAGGGVEDGERVLQILAEHPSTARFISEKLAQRFVSDSPPAGLVSTLATEFTRSGGEISAVLRVLLQSPAFLNARDGKFRRPLEFIAGLLRTVDPGKENFDAPTHIATLSRMGQIPHRWFPPDGFPDRADYWLNTAALLEYWNEAAAVAESVDTLGASPFAAERGASSTLAELVTRLAARLVQRPLRPQHLALLEDIATLLLPDAGLAPNDSHAALFAGLLLASPYFSLR